MSGHHHHHHHSDNIRNLSLAVCLTGTFLIAEIIGGLITHSLALLSDAAHMTTDVAALLMAIIAIKIGNKPADDQRTYGYRRLEILAAFFNSLILLVAAAYIMFEACQRVMKPVHIQSPIMMAIAAAGLVINLWCMRILSAGSAHSLNIKGAYLEVMADMVASAAVLLAGVIIYLTGWQQADPLIAIVIGAWILPRTLRLFLETVHILLQGTPSEIDIASLTLELSKLNTVTQVRDLHIWAVTNGENVMTAHLHVSELPTSDALLTRAREIAVHHHVTHSTFQIEKDESTGSHEKYHCTNHADEQHHHIDSK